MLSSKFTWKYFQTAWKISTFMLLCCVFTWGRSQSGQVKQRWCPAQLLLIWGFLFENKYPWVFCQLTLCWEKIPAHVLIIIIITTCMAVKSVLYCNAVKNRTLPEKPESISESRKELSHSLSRTAWSQTLLFPRFSGFWTSGEFSGSRAHTWGCAGQVGAGARPGQQWLWWVILPVTQTLPALLIGT